MSNFLIISKLTLLIVSSLIALSVGTLRYYGAYLSYATGDTFISTYNIHGGSVLPHRKWLVECLDGEAAIGIRDYFDDFERLSTVWCRFMFSQKPPSQGVYPYYPSCHVRNYTDQWFCYDKNQHEKTSNTFVTAFWDNEENFLTTLPFIDDRQNYKCCKTPFGYYIDYVSCYYMPTRDQYWEYYDATQFLLVYCTTGYAMTGISKKPNPRTSPVTTPRAPGLFFNQFNVEWIQCCRVGFGPPAAVAPPLAQSSYGETTGYVARSTRSNPEVPPGYKHQYRREARDDCDQLAPADNASLPNRPHCSAHFVIPPPVLLTARRR